MYRNLLKGQCAANERTTWIIYVKVDLIDCLVHHARVDPDYIHLAEQAMNIILESKIFDNSILDDKSRQDYDHTLSHISYVLWKRGKEVESIGDSLYMKHYEQDPTISSTTSDFLDQAYAIYDSANNLFTSSLKASPSEPASIDAYNIIQQKCNRNVRILFMPNNQVGFTPINGVVSAEFYSSPNHQTKMAHFKA